jgi:hypothetical protein
MAMNDPETIFDRELRPIVFREVMSSMPTTILDGESHEDARRRRFLEEAAAELAADAKIPTDAPWQHLQEGKDAFSIVEPDGTSIMHVSALANSTAARKLEANIRRVIVCVNACQEISNELLEASPITVIVGQMAKSVSDKTRDELLASLIEITDAVESAYELILEALPDGPIPDWFIRLESSAKQGRASISKARE